jgi:hypothetical protein
VLPGKTIVLIDVFGSMTAPRSQRSEMQRTKRCLRPGIGYVINVASYKNGVGYGKWTHIEGWSESVVEHIRTLELTE